MDALTVVRGLLAGAAATAVMTLIELPVRSRWSLEGLLDWQENQATAARLTKRSVEDSVIPGLGFHFLHGVLAGIALVLLLPLFPPTMPLWALGPGYGLVLYAISLLLYRPIMRGMSGSRGLGRRALAVGLLTHVAFGATLALLIVWP